MCSRVYSTSWLFTLSDQLTSKLDTCHSEIKRRTEILFISLSVINLIQLHDAKVKLICIVIASILDIDGWYINLSSMDDGGHQPHPFTIWAWHCISHIQGISLLGDNGRVTPLHPSLATHFHQHHKGYCYGTHLVNLLSIYRWVQPFRWLHLFHPPSYPGHSLQSHQTGWLFRPPLLPVWLLKSPSSSQHAAFVQMLPASRRSHLSIR